MTTEIYRKITRYSYQYINRSARERPYETLQRLNANAKLACQRTSTDISQSVYNGLGALSGVDFVKTMSLIQYQGAIRSDILSDTDRSLSRNGCRLK